MMLGLTFQYSCVRPKSSISISYQTPIGRSGEDLPCITTKLPFVNLHHISTAPASQPASYDIGSTDVHLRFFLSSSSFSSASASALPAAALPARLGSLGDMMNVLSAPRLTEAITKLFKLSLCLLHHFSVPRPNRRQRTLRNVNVD